MATDGPKRITGWPQLLEMNACANFAVQVSPRHLADMRRNLPGDVRVMRRCDDLMDVIEVAGACGLPAAVVVDDDQIVTEIAEQVLVAAGFEVVSVVVQSDLDERQVRACVRAACQPRRPVVALVDWSYSPGQDGVAEVVADELVGVAPGVRVILNSSTPPDPVPPVFQSVAFKTPAGMQAAALSAAEELLMAVPFYHWEAAKLAYMRADRPAVVAVPAIAGGTA